jgi:hypothetical protein
LRRVRAGLVECCEHFAVVFGKIPRQGFDLNAALAQIREEAIGYLVPPGGRDGSFLTAIKLLVRGRERFADLASP